MGSSPVWLSSGCWWIFLTVVTSSIHSLRFAQSHHAVVGSHGWIEVKSVVWPHPSSLSNHGGRNLWAGKVQWTAIHEAAVEQNLIL
ncbi:uncharacterized protein BDW47DRAFT_106323 [Aspergillus candidus]|uniref:Uncharacterized protein n=1 Tax=Aspergillus candidus TaxID=41067 RepID=A0A2I2FAX1_ASPCN|nr:hypothetical protein BDW47DRAFT_106323 [Aspergillus candidus]PLB37775.1 hypothetical protein BDW47DRAFT_106323 [Aspergillus candidus]